MQNDVSEFDRRKCSQFGLGLRTQHYEQALQLTDQVDFFELISENFMVEGGKPLHYLDAFAERFALVLHGVSLSIGSAAPVDREYLKQLRQLAARSRALWVSDHLCWASSGGLNSHDLLPLPLSYEALDWVVERTQLVQEELGQALVLENISTYAKISPQQMSEPVFLNEVTRATGAQLLLDVNNVYVNSRNHGFDPFAFIDLIDPGSVRQIHLAGHTDRGDHVIDTHDQPITPAVFALYEHAIRRLGPVPTLIERDDNLPPLAELLSELDYARNVSGTALVPSDASPNSRKLPQRAPSPDFASSL